MTASIIFLGLFLAFLVCAMFWIDSLIPTEEEEEERAKRDMEDLIRRTNEEHNHRPRVRAGNQCGLK
jgi:Na+-transporting methylmalonyl-CoA/oxaloacetate decarboxylase gamma subunit